MKKMIALHFLLILLHYAACQIAVNDDMKSFSHAHKVGSCVAGKEQILFEKDNGPGVITEQWFASTTCFTPQTIVRYYIDDDETPAIEVNLYVMHGMGGAGTSQTSWGTKWIGYTALGGGLYNTLRIPFQKSLTVSFIPAQSGPWWYILRGVENYPVIIGDLKLPSTAKLVVRKLENVTHQLFDYVNLAHSSKNGMLFFVTLDAQSENFFYLEGCYRILVGNDTTVQYLSSGTEDFFLSAYYFNNGLYHTEHSGLTDRATPGKMSAYKFFVADPMLFKNGFNLIWRIGEKRDNNCYHGSPERCYVQNGIAYCDDRSSEAAYEEAPGYPTTFTSYVWFYEW